RGTRGLLLLRRFGAEDAQNYQVILYLLECIEDSLPIASHGGVIPCAGRFSSCPASPSVEKGLRQLRPHRPKTARPGEPIQNRRALESRTRGKIKRRIISRLGNADLFVARC